MRFYRVLVLTLVTAWALLAGNVPRPAADLKFKTIDGEAVSLDALRGKVVIVMFFSTDCPHCQKTTQVLNPIYDKWKDRGLEVLGLAINPSAATNLREFATQYNVKFPLALSTRSECTRFAQISVMANFYVPYMFFVDRNGVIREEHSGGDRLFYYRQETSIPTLVNALLDEPAKG